MLTSMPANNPLEATLVADRKSKVIHDTAQKGLHGSHTAGVMYRSISFLRQGHSITSIFRRLVRLLDIK